MATLEDLYGAEQPPLDAETRQPLQPSPQRLAELATCGRFEELVLLLDEADATHRRHLDTGDVGSTLSAPVLAQRACDLRTGATLLVLALRQRQPPATLGALLRLGCLAGARGPAGEEPIHDARDGRAVDVLVQAGANPHIADQYGATPVMAASARGDLEAVRALCAMRVRVCRRDAAGRTALDAARAGAFSRVAAVLEEAGAKGELERAGRAKGRATGLPRYSGLEAEGGAALSRLQAQNPDLAEKLQWLRSAHQTAAAREEGDGRAAQGSAAPAAAAAPAPRLTVAVRKFHQAAAGGRIHKVKKYIAEARAAAGSDLSVDIVCTAGDPVDPTVIEGVVDGREDEAVEKENVDGDGDNSNAAEDDGQVTRIAKLVSDKRSGRSGRSTSAVVAGASPSSSSSRLPADGACRASPQRCLAPTALFLAAEGNHDAVVRYLLAEGAEVDRRCGAREETPLMRAVVSGARDAARVLLELGASCEAVDGLGRTTSVVAESWGRSHWVGEEQRPQPVRAGSVSVGVVA